MKIGIMGGSFDPVHFGHLIAAQDVVEQFQLDRLLLVPAAQTPLKPKGLEATATDRLAMLQAAVEGNPKMEISDFELIKGGMSYTIDTVRHFLVQYAGDELFWVIGGDQLRLLPQWKDIGELVKLIGFICIDRPGYPKGTPVEIPGLRLQRGGGHLIDISSSELRGRVKRGLSLDYFCPQKVIAYLGEKRLYC
jgi:nicotinate-nucleotide adenylyltransferase